MNKEGIVGLSDYKNLLTQQGVILNLYLEKPLYRTVWERGGI